MRTSVSKAQRRFSKKKMWVGQEDGGRSNLRQHEGRMTAGLVFSQNGASVKGCIVANQMTCPPVYEIDGPKGICERKPYLSVALFCFVIGFSYVDQPFLSPPPPCLRLLSAIVRGICCYANFMFSFFWAFQLYIYSRE